MAFEIIRNDITRVKADAIVNTANPMPVYAGGTDAAIYEAAGKEELLQARKRIGVIEPGNAVETPAFRLPAQYIIHTVGPVWLGGNAGEFETLRKCYENSLMLALRLGCKSIAFPLISTGTYGFPKDKALQIAMAAIQEFLMEHAIRVTLVVFDRRAFELSGNIVEKVREYVDSNYVAEANAREYRRDNLPPGTSMRPFTEREAFPANAPSIDLSSERRETGIGAGAFEEIEQDDAPAPLCSSAAPPTHSYRSRVTRIPSIRKREKKLFSHKKHVDIGELVASQEKTFQERLFEIIDERGLTGPQVYKNYISKQVYSKLQCDKDYHPNKYTAVALCLSLHLNLEQTKDLIGRAGWALSPSSKADLVVMGCIMNGEYNVMEINSILFDLDCPMLEKMK